MQNMTRIHHEQNGAALVVGLILLLVLTVLGVSTISTASLELAMAGNDQFAENAFQLAETGADTRMNDLNSGTFDPPNVVLPGCFPMGLLTQVAGAGGADMMGGTFQNELCFLLEDTSINACPGFSVGTSAFYYQNNTQGIAGPPGNPRASSMHRQGVRFCGNFAAGGS